MNNFGASGNSCTNLVHVVCRETGMKIWVPILGGLHPEKLSSAQLGAIFHYFRLQSWISPERMEISKIGIASDKLQLLRRSTKKKMVNFSPPTTNFRSLIWIQPQSTVSKDHILAPRGCSPQFLHVLQNDQGLLTHIWPGTGHPTISNNTNPKIGLKFSVFAVITLGPRGITLRNLFTWRVAGQAWQCVCKFFGAAHPR